MLAKNVTIDKYEERTDRFNVHGCWEWDAKLEKNVIVLGDVTIYELPTKAHEVCICAIVKSIIKQCGLEHNGQPIYHSDKIEHRFFFYIVKHKISIILK